MRTAIVGVNSFDRETVTDAISILSDAGLTISSTLDSRGEPPGTLLFLVHDWMGEILPPDCAAGEWTDIPPRVMPIIEKTIYGKQRLNRIKDFMVYGTETGVDHAEGPDTTVGAVIDSEGKILSIKPVHSMDEINAQIKAVFNGLPFDADPALVARFNAEIDRAKPSAE